MTLPIDELCDYWLDHYPVKGDTYDVESCVEDLKALASEVLRLQCLANKADLENKIIRTSVADAIAECERQERDPQHGMAYDPQRIREILEEAL